jgi:hypothetical protein
MRRDEEAPTAGAEESGSSRPRFFNNNDNVVFAGGMRIKPGVDPGILS